MWSVLLFCICRLFELDLDCAFLFNRGICESPFTFRIFGVLSHVTSRCNERKVIYLEDSVFEILLNLFNTVCLPFNWVIHAYCLMDNHYHLLVETPNANLIKHVQ